MNKKLLLIQLLSVFGWALSAQPDRFYPFDQIPDTLLKQANEVIREEVTTFKVTSLRSGTLTYRRVVTILNEHSKAHREIVFYDRDSRIRRFSANIYNAAGALIRRVDKKEIKDYSAVADFSLFQDDRVQILDIRHNEYPYTLEVRYEMQLSGHRYCNFPVWYIQQFGTSVESGRLVIDLPAGMKLHQQVLNIDLQCWKTEEKNREIYRWEVSQLPALPAERYLPPAASILPVVMTAPDQFKWGTYEGSMADWDAFGWFMGKLFIGKNSLPKSTVQEIRKLVADTDDPEEKIRRLYRHLQDNMRYVSVQLGIGGWQPFGADRVSANGYGDCKALCNYLKTLLEIAGIRAYPALIFQGDQNYEINAEFAVAGFNHMILYLPEEELWLECTEQDFPAGYIGAGNADRHALLITEAGGRLQKTPNYGWEENFETHRTTIALEDNGQAKLAVESRYGGASHDHFRRFNSRWPLEKQKEWLLRHLQTSGLSLLDYQMNCDPDRPQCRQQYTARVERYAQRSGSRLFMSLGPLGPVAEIPPYADHRSNPIHLGRSYSERDTLVINFPEGYALESAPEPERFIESSFGTYQRRLILAPDRLLRIRTLVIKSGQLPAEAYDRFRNFFEAVVEADNEQIVLRKK